MTDPNHIELLREIRRVYGGTEAIAALDAAITALSARASAGEGGEAERSRFHAYVRARGGDVVQREGEYISSMTRLWWDCWQVAAAPSPPRLALAVGGVHERAKAFFSKLRELADHDPADESVGITSDCWHVSTADLLQCMTAFVAASPITPASPATGDAATWEEEIRRHDATPPAHGDGEGDEDSILAAVLNEQPFTDRNDATRIWQMIDPVRDAREVLRAVIRVILTTRPTPEAQEARDAARWRALIGSARIRVLGSAGLLTDTRPDGGPWNGYAHIGLELWTKHEAGNEPTDAVEWLTKYTDAALALPAQGEGNNGNR